MGGKGRKRREKNYRSAHGGHNRLPPAPDPSQVDAMPSKLRKIMSFAACDGAPSVRLFFFFFFLTLDISTKKVCLLVHVSVIIPSPCVSFQVLPRLLKRRGEEGMVMVIK